MSNIIFNEHQMKQLEANPNVVKVSEKSITYSADFKVKAVKQNLEGVIVQFHRYSFYVNCPGIPFSKIIQRPRLKGKSDKT